MQDFVVNLIGTVIFAQMFAIGLKQTPGNLLRLLGEQELLWRSITSVLFVVPLFVIALIVLLRPAPEVVIGLALVAAAPGAPLTTRRSEAAGADTEYVASLQLMLALLAVVYTPLMLGLFNGAFDIAPRSFPVSPVAVLAQIGPVTFLPVVLGWLLSYQAPGFVRKRGALLLSAARVFYLVLLVAILLALAFVPELRSMMLIGWSGAAAVLASAALAIASGHVLGGPRDRRRSGLAMASAARNLGLALYIAEQNPWSAVAVPTILTYAVSGILLALPYSMFMKRRSERRGPEE